MCRDYLNARTSRINSCILLKPRLLGWPGASNGVVQHFFDWPEQCHYLNYKCGHRFVYILCPLPGMCQTPFSKLFSLHTRTTAIRIN